MKQILNSFMNFCRREKFYPTFIINNPKWEKAMEDTLLQVNQWALKNPNLARRLLKKNLKQNIIITTNANIVPDGGINVKNCPECVQKTNIVRKLREKEWG